MTAELAHGHDIIVGHNAVASIMAELGLKGLPTRKVPKGARVGGVSSLDLVRRQLYCCVVLDAFSRLVVGWWPDPLNSVRPL